MTDKITIKGAPPKFEESVLKLRCKARHNVYDQTDECTVLVRGEIAIQFLSNVIDHHTKGYTLCLKYPVLTRSGSYSCRMEKPDSIKISERQALDHQVKLDYVADLERSREEYRAKLTSQLLQTRERQEAKKAADKQAKVLAEIQSEVAATFGELIVPE
ncbi:hypothetical protein BI292_13630 [Pseudomonas sp. 43NM1]|uniref:hypothetical protein n=1 Tax=Pseudomonas sp. 43NM1 TaxID=1904755 RepID=UPI000C3317B9|nr:hypothetical protein [Pseudomonas sp. 43NM1]PKH24200.1 hypothetical protein BI292_13630 [Pseudomonas sp. 43NM1]